jgi:tRNA threonylcarbamoyladenosine biosynthesis protein TsaE
MWRKVMKRIKLTSLSAEETISLGARFAKLLKPGDIVCLFGDLGAGKTTLVKGLARGMKISPKKVHSPTFVLMNIYQGRIPLYHFDLYRILSPELLGMGYEEFFYGDGIAVIEWSEKLGGFMPREYWKVKLEHVQEGVRKVTISAHGERYKNRSFKVLEKLV